MGNTHHFSRAALLTSAFAAAVTGVAGTQNLPVIRCASAPDDDVSAFLYAKDAGLFARAGLDAVIQRSNSGAAVGAAVAGGAVDIGKSSIVSLIAAHQRGLPFVVIAAAGVYDATHPDVAMLVAKDRPIASPRELAGKVVSVPALGDLYTIASSAFVDAAGGAWKEIKYLELPSASSPEALAGHRVDAVTLATPVLYTALAAGKVRMLGRPFDAIAKTFLRAAWFTTKEYATKNADIVQRFRHTLEQASADVNAHPAASVAALAQFTGQDAAVIARMPRALAGITLEPKLLQPTIDAAFRYGAISTVFDARELFVPA